MMPAPAVLAPRHPAPAVLAPGHPTHPAAQPAAQRGSVTAEFAVALPAVVALLAMLLAGAAAGGTQLRLEESARAGARALARGEDPGRVQQIVSTLAGGTASATISTSGEWSSVTVTDRVGGALGAVIPWALTASASTPSERGAERQ
ncbi:TadE family type IV pilus minor pilin [Arthrobacter ulcerisalmonis]|uniref:TadE family type IV pilus minor pilin n=2 Tax=Arthrobacter ulcerisalmonis TaxID=2483813 RepID=UPI0036305C2C